jgi:hypothetical protein
MRSTRKPGLFWLKLPTPNAGTIIRKIENSLRLKILAGLSLIRAWRLIALSTSVFDSRSDAMDVTPNSLAQRKKCLCSYILAQLMKRRSKLQHLSRRLRTFGSSSDCVSGYGRVEKMINFSSEGQSLATIWRTKLSVGQYVNNSKCKHCRRDR